jgi:predicted MPP superfamily phosphohydrolase
MEHPEHSFIDLVDRVGETHLRQRVTIQVEKAAQVFGGGKTLFHIENAESLMLLIYYGLKISGLFRRGHNNALDIRVHRNTVRIPHLPSAFDGYRILHLTDLHLDIDSGLTPAILDRIEPLEYELAVFTGDYRAGTGGQYQSAMAEMARLIRAVKSPQYGILGNHDFIEFVPYLEEAGLPVLLNETVPIERDGQSIYLSGVDDPHFYETDNLQRARENIPANTVSILLAHSPELYRAAAASGYDLMLSGHTHAGQICLPGRVILMANARCPRRMWYGPWRYGLLRGYTSAGAGCSGVPVRFFSPPEIVIHTLCR